MSTNGDDEYAFFGAADPRMRALVQFWYDEFEIFYDDIWAQLDRTIRIWDRQSHEGKKALLKGSYLFSIVTQRNNTPVAEDAMMDFLAGKTLRDAFEDNGILYANQKLVWIHQSLWDENDWDNYVDLIDAGKIATAHQQLMENTVGVKAAKSGFVLANVGLVGQMCMDTNVISLIETGAFEEEAGDECTVNEDCFDGEDDEGDVICLNGHCMQPVEDMVDKADSEQYGKLCGGVQAMFPDLAEQLEPYELQWLLFDFQRYFRFGSEAGSTKDESLPIADHEEWFDVAIGETERLKSSIRRLSARSRQVRDFVENDPRYADYPNKLTSIVHHSRDPPLNRMEEMHRILDLIEAGASPGERPQDFATGDVEAIEEDISGAIDRGTREQEIEREMIEELEMAVDAE